MSYAPVPPMDILIEDFASPTKDLCLHCRSKGRFYFMQELVVTEATPKAPREFFRVCPWCDTDTETHTKP